MFKKDFPIFATNPGLVYLDNTASTQKPRYVIDGVSEFVSSDYANIHRGMYSLSERSEDLYHKSKEIVAEFLSCKASEIIYTYNSTYAFNLVAQSLCKSKRLGKGDTVLIGIWEHHSNVLPWQTLAQEYGFNVKFVGVDDNYDIDWQDFESKYDESVKVVSMSQVSNVTGKIYDVAKIGSLLRDETFFVVDGSQAVPNFSVNVQEIGCDCYVFTGHKLMAYTGIGVMYLSKENIKNLTPMILGGGTVQDVSVEGHKLQSTVDKWEAGTPNIIGAVSLLRVFEYIKSIGGISKIWEKEDELVKYATEKFEALKGKVELVGPSVCGGRVGVFSFVIKDQKNFSIVGEKFAESNICVRCGGHCAYPLHKSLGKDGTCRMSVYFYNDKHDLDKFFEVLKSIAD